MNIQTLNFFILWKNLRCLLCFGRELTRLNVEIDSRQQQLELSFYLLCGKLHGMRLPVNFSHRIWYHLEWKTKTRNVRRNSAVDSLIIQFNAQVLDELNILMNNLPSLNGTEYTKLCDSIKCCSTARLYQTSSMDRTMLISGWSLRFWLKHRW